ncbi:MAG: hypothetical protein HUU41_03400 [Bryobacteraceae bacterium]|nr:hypothetical protein [Bryobacterales bacterium]MEB2361662.1 hypothetical protein [Bryobacterales bacterium]NUN00137.1 hypothetical protein [Bryobacteraceae bacterium]
MLQKQIISWLIGFFQTERGQAILSDLLAKAAKGWKPGTQPEPQSPRATAPENTGEAIPDPLDELIPRLQAVEAAAVRLEGGLQNSLAGVREISEGMARTNLQIAHLERQTRILEKRLWWALAGNAATIAAVIALALTRA